MSNPHCECPAAGWCHRHKMDKPHHLHQMCQGNAPTASGGIVYWKAWEQGLIGATAPPAPILNPAPFINRTRTSFGTSPAPPISLLDVRGADRAILSRWFAGPGGYRFSPLPLIDRQQVVTHILYHVMPLAGDSEWIWRQHVQWLREVRPQFNGRLIVGIVTPGPGEPRNYSPLADVQRAFDGMDAEFVVMQNDYTKGKQKGRGEGITFPQMLAKINTTDPNHVFFYGHTKCVTRPEEKPDSAVHRWAKTIFDTTFRNRENVIDELDERAIVGSCRVRASKINRMAKWFYGGTFWACRCDQVFSRNWQKLTNSYGCVEMWVNGIFGAEEGGCVILDDLANSTLLYSPDFWNATGTPAFEQWQCDRGKPRPTTTIATVLFEPTRSVIENANRIFHDAKRMLAGCQTIAIDNSPTKTVGIEADVHHWNEGRNLQWGPSANQAVELATGSQFVHFSATRSVVYDPRWIKGILKPLSDPKCGMAGPVQAVAFSRIGKPNPRPGQREEHVQQAVFAARTEVLRERPWGTDFPHCYSDVWHSHRLLKAGLTLVDVPEVTSAAGLERCRNWSMIAAREKRFVPAAGVEPMRRSMIFHCYPHHDRDWRDVCMSTFRFRDVFDGRVLVSITTGRGCDDPQTVADWFQQFTPVEINVVLNAPSLGINTTFREQVKAIRGESGIVYKAHTKGISHEKNDPHRQWRDNMSHGCLEDVGQVEQKFREGFKSFATYRTVSADGCRVVNHTEKRWPGWHYPGAFFWFDPSAVPDSFFVSPVHHYENEEFPCILGPLETSYCLTRDNFCFRGVPGEKCDFKLCGICHVKR